MPPKKSDAEKDPEYVPSEEEVDDDEEEDEEDEEEEGEEAAVEGEPTTKKTKKTAKSKKKSQLKSSGEYRQSESEDTEDEEEDTAKKSSSKKKKTSKKEQDPDDDKKESTLGTAKKIVKKLKEKKEEVVSDTVIKKKFKRKSDQITATEGEILESDEFDKLLVSFPLPSSSRPQVFNKNISMIGSFNIQAFGTKKSSNNVIMRIITDILRHYGIILCQEIRANEDLIQKLTDEVSTPATPYDFVTSPPIGRTTYQERYVFLYRKNEWKVLEDYVIDDDDKLGDQFIREPYVARFQHLTKPDVRVTLVGCHTQPDKAFEEIKTLISIVYVDVKKKLQRDIVQEKRQLDRGIEPKQESGIKSLFWRYLCCCLPQSRRAEEKISSRDMSEELALIEDTNEPIVMMGDLNAAGSYVNKSEREELDALLKENNLIWGIKHKVDTTVADGPDTAYDRFIFEEANERKWIGNTKVWRFDEGWGSGEEVKRAAKRVSDHYPIEFEFKLS